MTRRPTWLATPSSHETLIHYTSPASAGAPCPALFAQHFGWNPQNVQILIDSVQVFQLAMAARAQSIARQTRTAPSSGAARAAVGAAREAQVAGILGGRVSNEVVTDPVHGTTDIDVVAPNGDLVSVGGPAKAKNLGNFGRSLYVYQKVAALRGVNVKVYLTSNTPATVVNLAERIVGAANVFKF